MKASPEPAKRFEIVDLEDGRVAIRDHQTGTTHLTTGRDDAVHDIAHLELCASEGDEQEIATHLAFNAATAERSFLATQPELAAPSPVPQPDYPAAAIIALAKTWKDAVEADRAGVTAIAEHARLNAVARELAGAEREIHLRRAEVSSTMAELFSDPDHAASRLATRGMALSLGDLARDPALVSPLATDRAERVQQLSAQLTAALQAAVRAQELASTHRLRAEALVGAGEPLVERLRSRADELMETAERRPNADVLLALGESVRGHLNSADAMTRARVATTVPETAELVRRETRGIGL